MESSQDNGRAQSLFSSSLGVLLESWASDDSVRACISSRHARDAELRCVTVAIRLSVQIE